MGVGPSRDRRFGRRNAPGRRSVQLEYCSRVLEEMLSKKHTSSAGPFYNLTEALWPRDPHNDIRDFMDLSMIKVRNCTKKHAFG